MALSIRFTRADDGGRAGGEFSGKGMSFGHQVRSAGTTRLIIPISAARWAVIVAAGHQCFGRKLLADRPRQERMIRRNRVRGRSGQMPR